jgi:hypothetical protein
MPFMECNEEPRVSMNRHDFDIKIGSRVGLSPDQLGTACLNVPATVAYTQ